MTTPTQSFIESQFPVSKISKESYKERKANYSQTLTGLGKWWGRKPLVLVRAVLLGLLLPVTNDPRRDREVFLELMTMDSEGLRRRKSKNLSVLELYQQSNSTDREMYFDYDTSHNKAKWKRGVAREAKDALQASAFDSLSYDQKLEYCERPENIDGPSADAWADINNYFGTSSSTLDGLVSDLGERRFGHVPRVGDTFCGGGSIPFEAARLGFEAYGSDLSPVAALLTWGALNLVGGGESVVKEVNETQLTVYEAVDNQVREWGIEHNESGWRADAFLYCAETTCPECGWQVPLASTWVIGEKTKTIARLVPDVEKRSFQIAILSGVSDGQMDAARVGTTRESALVCPNPACHGLTQISTLRGDGRKDGPTLRRWEKQDIVPRPDDVFQERLYCIRWVETYTDEGGELQTRRHYCSPTQLDLVRESRVFSLLQARFADWQDKGYVPDRAIEPGDKTDEPIRTRGWSYWHQLFTPRQLLVHGLFLEIGLDRGRSMTGTASTLYGIGRLADWDSKLCRWDSSAANEKVAETFVNQALNTLVYSAGKGFTALANTWYMNLPLISKMGASRVEARDARSVDFTADIWVTDPPYADAVNYHELSEFFLAWYAKQLPKLFPGWYSDSKRALAVKGTDDSFRQAMVACYQNLVIHMPENGLQVVMFTHQDARVWADLALILWAAGLRVTAAWTIATETESAMKKGNYVQGTVLLVLRKQTSMEVAFLDEVMADIRPEVERQLESMLALDDQDDPNFGDSDYQLAAYAAALRVLTQYARIEEIDPERELSRPRIRGETTPVEVVIERAVKVASNFLVPPALHDNEITRRDLWRNLTADERFYLKGLDVESRGEMRRGVYQEFARGFGIKEYTHLLQSGEANATRLKTASEFKTRDLGTSEFGKSLLRQILFAIATVRESDKAEDGLRWLHDEVPGDYWALRQTTSSLLRYLAKLPMAQWLADANVAHILAGAVENDSV